MPKHFVSQMHLGPPYTSSFHVFSFQKLSKGHQCAPILAITNFIEDLVHLDYASDGQDDMG